MIKRKKNIAGYYDDLGRFRPIRSPQYVGTPKRKATPKDRKKYSRAKAGDLGTAAQEKATGEDFFARLGRKEREAKAKTWARIEKETLGDADERDRGRSLVEFVRDKGGIKPGYKFGGKANRGRRISYDAGELAPLTYKESGKRGLVSDKGKLSLDRMFQSAREAGYAVADTWDLLSAMQDEINGGKVTYSNRGYMDYRDNPKAKRNGVLVGDKDHKSDLYVTQLGPRSFGVFLKTYLLKKFVTKVAAQRHIASIRAKAKRNPPDFEKTIRRKFAQYLTIRGYKKLAAEVRAGADIRAAIKAVYWQEPPAFKKKLKMFEALLPKKNPINIFGVVAAVSGVQSALQINEMLNKKKPPRRKPAAKRNTTDRTTAKRKNPHGDMPSGARFNEKLFDQDLAAIEDGNFRLIRAAKAHGRLAGYKAPEIDRLVQRARLAFQLKEMYRRKDNPADIATLLAPLKTNGAFKRMLQRRKAASALKRELKLERALEKTRAKKRKAISAATANPTRSTVIKRSRTRGMVTVTVSDNKGWSDSFLMPASTTQDRAEWEAAQRYHIWPLKVVVKRNPSRSAVGKKTVTRSAKANPKSKIRNPKSARPPRSRTFEMFQGRPVTNAVRRPVSRHAPAKLAQLGDLIEVKLVGMTPIKLNPSKAKLTAANGRLWIAGQRFAKPSASAAVNEINPIGEIDHVVYGTRKPHHGDHGYTHYIHKLGEDSGKRPLLCVDKEGFAVIRGGNYKIEARGIVD